MNRCRSCSAPILWAISERGRPMPLDDAPYTGADPRGLFVLRSRAGAPRRYEPPIAVAATPEAFPGEPVYRSHFATCPERDQWRRE